MSDLIGTLLEYADRTLVPPLLRAAGYPAASQKMLASWKGLEAGLTPEQRASLEALLEQEQRLSALDAEAVFRSGLSLGLELGRL